MKFIYHYKNSTMWKVLVFNLTTRWGMLHYSSQFCNELIKTRQVTAVIADYYDGFLYDKNISLRKIRSNPSLWSFIVDSLAFWRHIPLFHKIKKLNPDVIHFMDNHPRYPLYARVARRMWYKIYVTQHDPILHSGEQKTLLWKVAARVNKVLRNISDVLIVHGDKLKESVVSMYNISSNKIISVPHGSYTFFTRRAKWTLPKKNHFLFFGRIVAYKWLDVLLESLAFVKKKIPDFVLVIAGNWDIKSYVSLLDQHKENIHFYHYDIPDEEVYSYFEQSEFVVLPYKDATWSGIIPVAYAFGKPVITTDVWELSSHVQEGETGFIVDPNNAKQLADKIVWMLCNKKEVKVMGEKWKKYTEDVFGWDKIVRKIYM